SQRVRPGLAGGPAAAAWIELLAIAEGGRQLGIELSAHADRLRNLLPGIAVAEQSNIGRRTEPAASLLVLCEFGRDRRIGNREVVAVAGSHTEGSIGPCRRHPGGK